MQYYWKSETVNGDINVSTNAHNDIRTVSGDIEIDGNTKINGNSSGNRIGSQFGDTTIGKITLWLYWTKMELEDQAIFAC